MTALADILAQARGSQPTQDTPPVPAQTASRELTPEQAAMVQQLADARELTRIAKAHEETAKAAILEALGDAVLGTVDGKPVVQINAGASTRVDTDLLMQGWPEAWEGCKKTTAYKSIKVIKP